MSGFDTITGWAGQDHHILTIRRPIRRNVACFGRYFSCPALKYCYNELQNHQGGDTTGFPKCFRIIRKHSTAVK